MFRPYFLKYNELTQLLLLVMMLGLIVLYPYLILMSINFIFNETFSYNLINWAIIIIINFIITIGIGKFIYAGK